MAHDNFHSVFGFAAQMFRQLLRQIDRAMLTAGAPERHHQVLEAAAPISAHTRVHQRHDTGEKLLHALLLVEIVDDGCVFAGESLEALFASGIGEAAAIEDESAAIASLVLRQAPVK